MVATPTTVADTKLLQRQLLQQHLQNKIQQQQQQQQAQQQQQQQQQQLQNHQQPHQPNCVNSSGLATSLASSSPTSAAVKASLANFLQQQQQHQQQQQQQQQQSLAAALVLTSDANNNHQLSGEQQRSGSGGRAMAYSPAKHATTKTPNGLQSRSLQQAASFPSLLSPKTASLPEPFILTKQPPDYDEATKHLNKTRQAQQMLPLNNLAPASSKQNRPRSIKSKDVDDVLEILIKNGELPPSAAQEPPTPTTPGTPITDMSGLLACTPPSFPTPPPSSEGTTTTQGERNSPSLALSGDGETPPPSASLDFDFHLDLDDFEGMDLGMLTDSGPAKNQVPRNHYTDGGADLSDPALSMEIELSDWLDVMMPQTTTSSTSALPNSQVSSSSATPCTTVLSSSVAAPNATQHDPLLSTNASVDVQDPFDLFAVNDADFRAWDDFRTNWDSADFIA
uniref:Putative myocardin-related transcription factor n=1 Tax=Rhipicephalus pulchellus TaxID=72859 RepID=L7M1T9_RHIPC